MSLVRLTPSPKDGEVRDHRGRLTALTVDGITYHADDREGHAQDGLAQMVRDGNRLDFPTGAMRCTPDDVAGGA